MVDLFSAAEPVPYPFWAAVHVFNSGGHTRSDIEHIDPLEKRSGFIMMASN